MYMHPKDCDLLIIPLYPPELIHNWRQSVVSALFNLVPDIPKELVWLLKSYHLSIAWFFLNS